MFRLNRAAVMATIAAAILVATLSTAWGQGTPAASSPEDVLPVTKLLISPAAEPDPPLRYSLVPAYGDLQPGNAATSYYHAIMVLPTMTKELGETQSMLLEVPMAQFPREKAHKWLNTHRNVIDELHIATLRETCDWDHRALDLKGFSLLNYLVPEIQETRNLVRILRIKARLEISERRFDDALDTMTMGYRLATNVGRTPFLMSSLLGIALASTMNECVKDWIDAGGPNLYWALAGLPNSVTDIDAALLDEVFLSVQMFPILTDPEHADFTPAQWKMMFAQAMQSMNVVRGGGFVLSRVNSQVDLRAQLMATALILAGYPVAKEQLIASGMDAAAVEAMPAGQVVAIVMARFYRKTQQEVTKWSLVPYWQSREPMRSTLADVQAQCDIGAVLGVPGMLPTATELLRSSESVQWQPVRLQRDLAALQTIEALRMAAARSDGQWPQSLDELTFAPAPIDPVTGHSFTYAKLENGNVELILAPPPGRPASNFGKRFELELKK